jgi:hypothetical protein
MTYSILYSTKSLQLFLEGIAIISLLMAFVAPQTGASFFRRCETRVAVLARKPWRAIAAAALFPLIVRALLLPVFPLPLPRVHDEFSYLLLGDTLAHGRLANPSPPFWKHFETEYELVRPTYASQYQPAQGVALAAGQSVTGHAWWGVWLSVGLMCGALCWALTALLPWRWALFGSVLAALQFGIYGFWMNSYFGGAVAATAGALVFGAIARPWMTSNITICALGLIGLFASRPLEGLLWMGVVCAMALTRRRKFAWRPALAFFLVLTAGVGALAYYNSQVTGNPAESPYALYRADYGTPQSYWWQSPVIVRHFDHPELEANYRDQLRYWQRRYSAAALWDSTWRRLRDFWRFFIGPFLTPALLFTAFTLRRKKLRPWLWVSGIFILDHATYHAWYPQQSAGETVLILLLLVESWRHLRAWQRQKSFGLACSRHLIAGFAFALILLGAGLALKPALPDSWSGAHKVLTGLFPAPDSRQRAVQLLRRIPGKHLVFVRYEAKHNWYDEWVFNDADINSSRIVFARVCTPDSDRALAESMKDRDVWMADLGASLELSRLAPARVDLASKTPTGVDLAFALPAAP